MTDEKASVVYNLAIRLVNMASALLSVLLFTMERQPISKRETAELWLLFFVLNSTTARFASLRYTPFLWFHSPWKRWIPTCCNWTSEQQLFDKYTYSKSLRIKALTPEQTSKHARICPYIWNSITEMYCVESWREVGKKLKFHVTSGYLFVRLCTVVYCVRHAIRIEDTVDCICHNPTTNT